MLTDDDVKNLEAGANIGSKWHVTAMMMLVSLLFVICSVGQIIIASKYARNDGIQFSEVLSIYAGNIMPGQTYSAGTVHAVEALSTAWWQFLVAVLFMVSGVSLRRRGQLYVRLRKALYARNA